MIRSTGRLCHVTELNPDTIPLTDCLELDWFETSKTIIRKKTRSGLDVAIRKDSASGPFSDGDVVYLDDRVAVVLAILPCDCLVMTPSGFDEMAAICHEIGNRHIPVHIAGENEIVTEYEYPLYYLLSRKGYTPKREKRVLFHTHTLSMTEQRSQTLKVTFK